jgi:hypothetical protein
MGAQEELTALAWTVETKLDFDKVIAEADQVIGVKPLPDNWLKRGLSMGAFRTDLKPGVSADYQFANLKGHGVLRLTYSDGEQRKVVRLQIVDANLKRQRLMLFYFIPIPISPWYAPAMPEFRDASARARARIEAR